MTNLLEKRDWWGNGLALWVLVAMVFVCPLAIWSLTDIRLANDMRNWLPEDNPEAKKLTWHLSNFKRDDRILVSWEGSSLTDPRLAAFARKLEGVRGDDGIYRGGVKQVHRAITPYHVLARMLKYGISPEDAVERLRGMLIGSGPLKIRLSQTGRNEQDKTTRMLTERVRSELGFEIDILEPATEWVPDNAFSEEASAVEPYVGIENIIPESDEDLISKMNQVVQLTSIREHDFQIRWKGIQPGTAEIKQVQQLALDLRGDATQAEPQGVPLVEDIFLAPGSPLAVSIVLSDAGSSDKHGTLDAIRGAAVAVGIKPEHVHMGGRLVASAALNKGVKAAAWNRAYPIYQFHQRSVILLSGLVGIVLAFVMLRSFRLATIVLFVTYYTVILAVALVPATGGSMNMVLVVMPTLLMVLTLSASIHLANYWKHAAHDDPRTAVREAVRMARVPCTLAAVTTAIGLMSLTTSSLSPVSDFGLYSAMGCLVALVMVLFGLPALLKFWPAKPPTKAEIERKNWRWLGDQLIRFRRPVVGFALTVFVVGTLGLLQFQTETKVIRLFPEDSRVVQDYRFLEENLVGIVPVDLIVRFNESAQDRMNFMERMEVVRTIEEEIRQHPEISGSLALPDFQKIPTKPAANASFLKKLAYNKRVNEIEKHVRASTDGGIRSFYTIAKHSADIRLGDGRLSQPGDELWRITAQVSLMSDAYYGDLTKDLDNIASSVTRNHAGTRHIVTGMVPLFLATQQAVLHDLIRSFAIAFALIAVVMMVVLKNPISGLIAMLPNLMPVGLVFGLVSWCGMAVDIGTMITASVALGIAVDGTLHLISWFREGIRRGLDREDAVREALSHCGPAMWQTSLAVGLGLMVLYPADLLLISRFGWLMAALIGAALVADVILLPALLAGWLGALIQKTTPVNNLPDTNQPSEIVSQTGPHQAATAEVSTPSTVSKMVHPPEFKAPIVHFDSKLPHWKAKRDSPL